MLPTCSGAGAAPKKRALKAKAAQGSQSSGAEADPSANAALGSQPAAAAAPAPELSLMERLAGGRTPSAPLVAFAWACICSTHGLQLTRQAWAWQQYHCDERHCTGAGARRCMSGIHTSC